MKSRPSEMDLDRFFSNRSERCLTEQGILPWATDVRKLLPEDVLWSVDNCVVGVEALVQVQVIRYLSPRNVSGRRPTRSTACSMPHCILHFLESCRDRSVLQVCLIMSDRLVEFSSFLPCHAPISLVHYSRSEPARRLHLGRGTAHRRPRENLRLFSQVSLWSYVPW